MKKKVRTFYKLPDGEYISRERTFKTNYRQDKNSGMMTGRKEVKGKGDGTGVIRVEKDFILVKKSPNARGHIRTTRQRYKSGQIHGRF